MSFLLENEILKSYNDIFEKQQVRLIEKPLLPGEWPSGLYFLRQVTEVKLGRVRSDFGWVTSEA